MFCDATNIASGHDCRCSRLLHSGKHSCAVCGTVWADDDQPLGEGVPPGIFTGIAVVDEHLAEQAKLRDEIDGLRTERGNALLALADAGEALTKAARESKVAMEELDFLRAENGDLAAQVRDLTALNDELQEAQAEHLKRIDELNAEKDTAAAAFEAAAGSYDCPCGSTFDFEPEFASLEDYAALNRWLGTHDGTRPECDVNREGSC
jgi:predicted  nucleic acid-binding Zn-ribbon protein